MNQRSDAAPANGSVWAMIAGGGTAGHALPGLAVARALVEAGHRAASIHFVGSARGVEARLVPAAGFSVTVLPGRGIQRKLALANVGAVIGLVGAFARALWLVGRLRPKVVLSLGGYASVPCAMAAVVWRVPIVVAEQNAVPGAANRLVSRFAKAAAVSFPDTPLPRAVLTGNPVRAEVSAIGTGGESEQRAARKRLDIDDARRVVLVFGGSLGALRINQAVLGAVGQWRDRKDLAVRHIVGDRDWEIVQAERPSLPPDGLQYQALRYDDDMATSLAVADLAVCRSGATTSFELAAAGLPAVLVPSPNVVADHQTANARHMEACGGAVLVPDAQLDADRLLAEVEAVLASPERLSKMAAAMRRFAAPDAAARVAAIVEEHARA